MVMLTLWQPLRQRRFLRPPRIAGDGSSRTSHTSTAARPFFCSRPRLSRHSARWEDDSMEIWTRFLCFNWRLRSGPPPA
eukprot:CAMPEP_0203843222 /NCGR_PEP_ID=MMETSP0359-20131031/2478_1 /ASSEMBLY_ACC=CAM_ASM_000338 /TAXON_ID=268821 /ORGANISM="Scrippsiella Hangoei, Strain SHTV-5" /LENGTH=78 /DNA_ID=CAMNT_0050757973 /DNA_START=35 /DNA_END=268 /DNA_ORIENTATION=-